MTKMQKIFNTPFIIVFAMRQNEQKSADSNKVKLVLIIFICLSFLQLIFGSAIYEATYTILFSYDQIVETNLNNTNTTTTRKVTFTEKSSVKISSNKSSTNLSQIQLCPKEPTSLVGRVNVSLKYPSFHELETLYHDLDDGGHGKPSNCTANHRVAIVIPFRDREKHLRAFLHNMHPILKRQQLNFAIYVVEQVSNQTFNRGKLMNVGYVEAKKQYNWQCAIFHDVDLLPEDDRNLYTCPEHPRHMSIAVDKFSYRLPYQNIFGGVSALKNEHFEQMNGYSNDYWGWGGEDDDMRSRISFTNHWVIRYPMDIGRYKMIRHRADERNPVNPCRFWYMGKTWERWKIDGLTSLEYRLLKLEKRKLYTWILVDLLEEKAKEKMKREKLCY